MTMVKNTLHTHKQNNFDFFSLHHRSKKMLFKSQNSHLVFLVYHSIDSPEKKIEKI